MKIIKKKWGGGLCQGGGWLGGQGGWERRIEAFVKIQKNIYFFWGGWGRVGGGEGASVGGFRVDVNGEVKIFVRIQKKNFEGGGGVRVGGSG